MTAANLEHLFYLVINWLELAVPLPDARASWSRYGLRNPGVEAGYELEGSRLMKLDIYYPASHEQQELLS